MKTAEAAATVSSGHRLYCQEILRFRKALNLTSISSMEMLISRFIVPSILLQQWIPAGAALLDIGSGMGVPGVPLLLSRDDIGGVLVERRMKRAEFLRHVVRRLGLRCEVHCCDVRQMSREGLVDVVVARAVVNPAELLAISAPLVRAGGEAILPTGDGVHLLGADGWCVLQESELQFGDGMRQRVLRYRRL
ncbi:MAG: 16S rRNA (guanine(527)-N(7))-methyltransferase RsmG [Mariprofundales bacterium]|nr:16S rRNA (guanine(527)-N(7))-methyltransferase RsmG [Mariprofundales bacterium]